MPALHLLFESVENVVLHPTVHSALVLFFASMVNEIPGFIPFSTVVAGQIIFFQGAFDLPTLSQLFYYVVIPVGMGSAIGTLPVYSLSYWGGKRVIKRYSKYLRFSWEDVEKMNERFKGAWYDEIVFCLLHSVPALPSIPLTIFGGVIRMPFWKYFILSSIGYLLRMVIGMALFSFGILQLSKFAGLLYN